MMRILWSNQTILHQFLHVLIYLVIYMIHNCLIAVGIIQRGIDPVAFLEIEPVMLPIGKAKSMKMRAFCLTRIS